MHEEGVKNFKVLEAKNYIGGRLNEVVWEGVTIAMGAGWIHKIEENHDMYKLAQKYGLQYHEDNYNLDAMSVRYLSASSL